MSCDSDVVRWIRKGSNSKNMYYNKWKILNFFIIILVLFVINDNFVIVVGSSDDIVDNNINHQYQQQYNMDNKIDDYDGHFTPTWAVHITGGNKVADCVASEHGFINLGKIFDDYYHFSHHSVSKRSISPSNHHQGRLDNDHRVRWSQQQKAKSRQKRDLIRFQPLLKTVVQLNDPKWNQMWYLNRGNNLDMNVIPAWREGITGRGVVVTILDDGLESDHPDLDQNYDPKASYDVNSHDDDPMPHYDLTDSNRHGTRCAGEVAATANNSLCAVGIAYGASVGGVRMLDGDVTDAVEARSLSLNPQHIDIYSASWGPDDDGKTVDGPGELATRAFIEGATKGRGGKGSIFVWASGNGGREHDNCNCDGYTNSIWTLSISSATEEGLVPWYSEMCSSTLATTYSSGGQNEKQIVTTDLHHSCTISHTGTSASAPLAAGIVALVLEANRNLTWRDVQHIVVRTAKPINLKDPTWGRNGVGRRVSHSFGYGLMDAAAMVKAARNWKTVPQQQRCEINAPHLDKTIPPKSQVILQLTVQHCRGVNFLEHVQAKISLTSQRRGDIQIYLTSPAGTRVTLLTSRSHDVSRSGFNQWPFMSVHTWGEAPHGNWQLEIHNEGRFMGHAALKGWSLIFYGTMGAVDRNDPRSSTPAPLPGASLSINNYSIMVPNRQQNASKNNRKQQQQQQQQLGIVTPFVFVSPKKNGKNSKNNNNNNNNNYNNNNNNSSNNNNNGKNGNKNNNNNVGSHRTTTQKSFLTSRLDKDRKMDFSQTVKPTTFKPKLPLQNTNNVAKKGQKFQLTLSKDYEKTPIKSPKQVKENFFTTSSNTQLDIIDTIQPTSSNSNIPRMFQQYEKIQHIYPEFHPYTGPRENTKIKQSSSSFGFQSNGKPSRENSKIIFFPEQDFSGGVGSSGGNIGIISSKKSTITTPNTRISSVHLNSKAQITQWDLNLYGTETSSQPDDPPRYGKPGINENTYGSEMEHNSLEFGSETASGQWRDTHQVGESHVDVQRTISNDITSTACTLTTPDKKCLECFQNTFLFDGHCYSSCPERTFMASEIPRNQQQQQQQNQMNNKSQSLQLSLRSTTEEFQNLDDILVMKRKRKRTIPQKLCYLCHSTCLKCNGPNENDCLQCFSDYDLIDKTCFKKNFTKKLIDEYYNLNQSLTIIIAIIIIITILIICLIKNFCIQKNDNKLKEYAYDKVNVNIPDEDKPMLDHNLA